MYMGIKGKGSFQEWVDVAERIFRLDKNGRH